MKEEKNRDEYKEQFLTDDATEVMIDGRTFSLTGGDEAYLREVAAYIDGKIATLRQGRQYSRQNSDYRKVMLWLSLADDYMQEKAEREKLLREAKSHEAEVYSLKREIVEKRLQLEEGDARLKKEEEEKRKLKERMDIMQERIAELEKEIDEFLSK